MPLSPGGSALRAPTVRCLRRGAAWRPRAGGAASTADAEGPRRCGDGDGSDAEQRHALAGQQTEFGEACGHPAQVSCCAGAAQRALSVLPATERHSCRHDRSADRPDPVRPRPWSTPPPRTRWHRAGPRPRGDPAWVRPALLGLLVATALLYIVGLGASGLGEQLLLGGGAGRRRRAGRRSSSGRSTPRTSSRSTSRRHRCG